eukprot:7902026-Pyramimonas_sp.AAC.1
MRRGGRFLATPLGNEIAQACCIWMFASDARLRAGRVVLVCLCASHGVPWSSPFGASLGAVLDRP